MGAATDLRDLSALIDARAAATPDLVALVAEDGTTVTFAEYRTRVRRLAGRLGASGVQAGTRVSWQLPTSVPAMVLVGALSALHAVQNPILPAYRERELSFIVDQCRPDVFITRTPWRGVDYPSLVASVVTDARTDTQVWTTDGEDVDHLGAHSVPLLGATAGEGLVRWIFYTSGTTADPKGALHSDTSIIAGPRAMVEAYGVTASDRYPMVFPFTHVGGVQMLVLQLFTGCSAIVVDHYDAEATPEVIAKLGTTLLAGGTPLAIQLLAWQRAHRSGPLFPNLRAVFAGAAPKPLGLHQALREEMGGIGALSCYGLTEAPMSVLSRLGDTDEQLATTEGKAIPGCEVRAVADDGSLCQAGAVGELRLRGPQMFRGYLDPAREADAFDADGYFHTGDLGTVDQCGYVRVVGRLKDVIIRNGEKISCAEVEQVLAGLVGVREVVVIGMPDERTGERCCAAVVAVDGRQPPTRAEVAAHCRAAGLAAIKIPEQVEVVEAIPRNATGKVEKQKLREWIAQRRTDEVDARSRSEERRH